MDAICSDIFHEGYQERSNYVGIRKLHVLGRVRVNCEASALMYINGNHF